MSETSSGSGKPRKPKTWQESIAELPGRVFKSEAKLIVAAAAAGIAAFAWGQQRMEAKTAEQIDAGIVPVEKRLSIVEQQQKEQRADLREVQADIRALYKAVMTGAAQPRLERPLPTPDAGP